MHNDNEATTNELGHTARSGHQSGLRPANTLGALVVRDVESGVEFRIGTGFDQADRDSLWRAEGGVLGRIVKYKFFPVGVKEKPRHPVFLGFRDKRDMS